MNLFRRFSNRSPTVERFKLITDKGNGFYAWDGKTYQSDVVRSCIRPKVKAVGKLTGKHIRKDSGGFKENPEAYIRFVLEEPNPFMTGQMLQEKMATQLCLNNNAFALIVRDEYGYPASIYPLAAMCVEAVYDSRLDLNLRFLMRNGKSATYPYSDIIHLRQDFNENDIFGESPAPALAPLMEIVNTTDQGIVRAIRNSGIVQWLLKFTSVTRPDDLKTRAKEFAENYLSIDSDLIGVAATDSKAEVTRVEPKDYVPNAAQMDRTTDRILSFFNTNRKIIQSSYSEDDWTAYYEAEIEPVSIQLSGEYTRKFFSRRERGFGNRIYFESSNLQYASMSTKLALQAMVDRGAMTPNEWREALGIAPLPDGDTAIRRLDTKPIGGQDEARD